MDIIKTKWGNQYLPRLTSKISWLYMAQTGQISLLHRLRAGFVRRLTFPSVVR